MLEFVILLYILVTNANFDRAEYLLDSAKLEYFELDYVDYKHLVSKKYGYSLNFKMDSTLPSHQLHSVSVLDVPFDSDNTRKKQAKLNGYWISIPIELGCQDGAFPFDVSPPCALAVDTNLMEIGNGTFRVPFLVTYSSTGPLLKSSITFPMKQERDSFMENKDCDHSSFSQYYIVGDAIAIGWQPMEGNRWGRLLIHLRVKP